MRGSSYKLEPATRATKGKIFNPKKPAYGGAGFNDSLED
jgi:hypothetical protein